MQTQQRLIEAMSREDAGTTHESTEAIRDIYQEYISRLFNFRLISQDDAETYREVYPMFEPFFVYYDGPKDSYENLSDLATQIMAGDGGWWLESNL